VAGEDWEARLGGLIEQSDTVVFVVSPGAVKSERCEWEVDRTLELSKRLLPVIFKPIPEHDIPKKLSRLQFVRFDTGRGITRPLAELAEALQQDLDWIREHTRVGELARRWEGRRRPESLLLRGDDLEGTSAPRIISTHLHYQSLRLGADAVSSSAFRRLPRSSIRVRAVGVR
jgi:TIR domain